jgi:hypothetical protein
MDKLLGFNSLMTLKKRLADEENLIPCLAFVRQDNQDNNPHCQPTATSLLCSMFQCPSDTK